jgi:hypothetical protein
MITKIFLFQFVNSYASFFYLAFIAESIGDCPDSGCMGPLAINLAIIFGSRLLTGNLFELLIPYLSYQYKYRTEILFHGDKISRPEKEFLLDRVSYLSAPPCSSFLSDPFSRLSFFLSFFLFVQSTLS